MGWSGKGRENRQSLLREQGRLSGEEAARGSEVYAGFGDMRGLSGVRFGGELWRSRRLKCWLG